MYLCGLWDLRHYELFEIKFFVCFLINMKGIEWTKDKSKVENRRSDRSQKLTGIVKGLRQYSEIIKHRSCTEGWYMMKLTEGL